MLPPRAANGYIESHLAFLFIKRDEKGHQIKQLLHEHPAFLAFLHKVPDELILSIEFFQVFNVMGFGRNLTSSTISASAGRPYR